ncbi:hypothetical protein AB0F96_12330 [Streptomyces sp. NPDC023998]|uniref:hypothetical protein n=1 Tax=Streptomyces sp. NPDC023998 TaxID=3154597 RepID=UPI0033D35D4B
MILSQQWLDPSESLTASPVALREACAGRCCSPLPLRSYTNSESLQHKHLIAKRDALEIRYAELVAMARQANLNIPLQVDQPNEIANDQDRQGLRSDYAMYASHRARDVTMDY